MQVRYVSDLHFGVNRQNRFEIPFNLETMDNEHEQILILAGDVCDHSLYGIDFVEALCTRFNHVLYVFGNHEYYQQSISGAKHVFLKQFKNVPDNFHLLDCDTFEIDNIMFIGATLWTDLDKYNILTLMNIQRFMNDCKMIRIHDKSSLSFKGDAWYNLHVQHRDYIDLQCQRACDLGKTPVVITHHAPSLRSIHEVFKTSDMNGGFASDIDWLLEKHNIAYWIHGHMHHRFRYNIHGTEVLCNPRGYLNENLQERDGNIFDSLALFEVN